MRKTATVFAGISGCIAVILGALGAHYLNGKADAGLLSLKSFHAYETAVNYQLLHSIAIIAVVALQVKFPMYFKPILYFYFAGIILFSGSIYVLVMSDIMKFNASWLGPVTPIGGISLIIAWFLLFLSAVKYKDKPMS
jgi:uncharacterized membrane protein YgdD (TMEM256/DUF423 family)